VEVVGFDFVRLDLPCHFFSFTKSENRRAEQVLLRGLLSVGGEEVGEGYGRVNNSANTVYTCM
jgi:hypothetical protein